MDECEHEWYAVSIRRKGGLPPLVRYKCKCCSKWRKAGEVVG